MSKNATKWIPITNEEYFQIYNPLYEVNKARLYSSYTNHEGNDGLSCTPEIFTSWGDDEKELIKCRRTKRDREQKDWDDVYHKAIAWEEE